MCFSVMPAGMSERERQVMKKLQVLVDKQRDEIRAKDHELTLRNEDVEAVRVNLQYIGLYIACLQHTYWPPEKLLQLFSVALVHFLNQHL